MKQLHIYFFTASLIVFLLGKFDLSKTVFDININDGFYIFSSLFSNFYALFLLIIGLLFLTFRMLNVNLNPKWTKVYSIVTIGLIIIYWLVNFLLKIIGVSESDNLTKNVIFTVLLFGIFALQVIYLVSLGFRKINN